MKKLGLVVSLILLAVPARAQEAAPAPESLMGLTGDDLRARFGDPRLVRTEHPGHFWQFVSEGCVLTLYLYEPPLGGIAKVEFAEARLLVEDPAIASPDKVDACLTTWGTP